MLPDLSTLLIVCPLVFLGGFVDSIAGGGGLITLPGYLIAGIPPHLAIGTNKLSSDMGLAVVPVAAAFAGSLAGAAAALMVPASVFQIILLCCLPLSAVIVLRKKSLEPEHQDMPPMRRRLLLGLCAFVCGAYDGFYGPGAGTFMLLAFSAVAKLGVRDAAGQMKIVNFSSGMAALVTFAAAGEVNWALGLSAGVFGVAGHYIGSGLVMKNGSRIVRPIIALVLLLLFIKTAWDYLA